MGASALPGAELQALCALVAAAARAELMPRFADVQRHMKHDGSLVTAADLAMQARVRADLARAWPQYAFVGEEMPAAEQQRRVRESGAGLWCLDPLDGTSNFAAGIPFFAVSLALVMEGRVELALVHDPVRDECFVAHRGHGAWRNAAPLAIETDPGVPLDRAIAVVDFKRLDAALAARLGAAPPYGSQRNFGASSLEWCWLADGRFHVYLHGGQKLWDHAAGGLILSEAGGLAKTLDGEPVFRFELVARSVVAARHAGLFADWHRWLDQARRDGSAQNAC
ncbi:MAG TPA: inositol monophosphatase family protein [Acidiferrobacterales bacterium]